MKQIRKQLAALLLAVALAAACAAPAFAAATAASIELTRKGSITVTLRDSESGSAVSGGKLTLYQVASISRKNGNLSYDYTNGFENCGVSLGDLSESDLARTLDDKRPAGSKGETLTVDTDGRAVFSRLPLGLYLVVQSTASTGYEKINPFLVSVPLVEEDTYLYDVDALPKVGDAHHPAGRAGRTRQAGGTGQTHGTREAHRAGKAHHAGKADHAGKPGQTGDSGSPRGTGQEHPSGCRQPR